MYRAFESAWPTFGSNANGAFNWCTPGVSAMASGAATTRITRKIARKEAACASLGVVRSFIPVPSVGTENLFDAEYPVPFRDIQHCRWRSIQPCHLQALRIYAIGHASVISKILQI